MVANFIQQQAMAVLDTPFASAISMVLLAITLLILYAIHASGTKSGAGS
jgi:ABC-type spermidine/putrescine transport system permease subunit I